MKMVRMILYAVMIDSGFYLTVSAQEIFVTWNLQTDVIRFGEDMVLVYNVHGVTRIDNGLIRQWSRDNDLITFNGKCKDPNKYEEIVSNNNQISLKISNVTEEDLNCNYQCRYSFHVYTKRLDIGPDIFEYPPSPETTVLNYTNITGRPAISLSIKKIYPLPNCSIMLMGKKSDFQVVNDSQTGLFYKVYLVHPEEDTFVCRKDLTVYCQLISGYSLNLPLPEMSDANMCKVNLPSLIIGLGSSMLISILLLCLCLKRQRTSDRKDTTVYYTNVKSENEERSVIHNIRMQNITSSTLPGVFKHNM